MVTMKRILSNITTAVALAMIILSLFGKEQQPRKTRNATALKNEPKKMDIPKASSNNIAIKRSLPPIAEKTLPPIAIVICPKKHHYLNQITVLLKSASSLTTKSLRFMILTKSKKVFRKIASIPDAWPDKYKRRIRLERRGVETSRRKDLNSCGLAGLFLPDILSDVDSAVLLNVDSIFLRPPEQLLSQIHKFNGSHAIGVAQGLSGYIYRKSKSRILYAKPRGINVGVMIMNMTRLRALPSGWSHLVQQTYSKIRRHGVVSNFNDIINYLLAKKLELYYDLNCVWNYNTGTCVNELNSCMDAEETGIYLLSDIHSRHGGKYKKFQVVFEAWLRHEVGSGLSDLVQNIRRRIRNDEPSRFWCNELSTMEYMLTRSLAALAD